MRYCHIDSVHHTMTHLDRERLQVDAAGLAGVRDSLNIKKLRQSQAVSGDMMRVSHNIDAIRAKIAAASASAPSRDNKA